MAFPLTPTNGQRYTDPVSGLVYTYNAPANSWIKTGSVAGAPRQEVKPITTNGQTVFTTLTVPLDASRSVMNVNGVDYYQTDYSVAGNVFTWAGPIRLEITDKLVITYV